MSLVVGGTEITSDWTINVKNKSGTVLCEDLQEFYAGSDLIWQKQTKGSGNVFLYRGSYSSSVASGSTATILSKIAPYTNTYVNLYKESARRSAYQTDSDTQSAFTGVPSASWYSYTSNGSGFAGYNSRGGTFDSQSVSVTAKRTGSKTSYSVYTDVLSFENTDAFDKKTDVTMSYSSGTLKQTVTFSENTILYFATKTCTGVSNPTTGACYAYELSFVDSSGNSYVIDDVHSSRPYAYVAQRQFLYLPKGTYTLTCSLAIVGTRSADWIYNLSYYSITASRAKVYSTSWAGIVTANGVSSLSSYYNTKWSSVESNGLVSTGISSHTFSPVSSVSFSLKNAYIYNTYYTYMDIIDPTYTPMTLAYLNSTSETVTSPYGTGFYSVKGTTYNIDISSYKGKYIIPYDYTGTCTIILHN